MAQLAAAAANQKTTAASAAVATDETNADLVAMRDALALMQMENRALRADLASAAATVNRATAEVR